MTIADPYTTILFTCLGILVMFTGIILYAAAIRLVNPEHHAHIILKLVGITMSGIGLAFSLALLADLIT